MGRSTDRRDMTKAVESGVKLQTNKQTNLRRLLNINRVRLECVVSITVLSSSKTGSINDTQGLEFYFYEKNIFNNIEANKEGTLFS